MTNSYFLEFGITIVVKRLAEVFNSLILSSDWLKNNVRLPSLAIILLISILGEPVPAKEVIIKPGETLSQIANRYNVSIDTLKTINLIQDENQIKSGSKLKLPTRIQNSSVRTTKTHAITSGETISSIASKYGIKQNDLISLNSNLSLKNLQVGQKIQIPINPANSTIQYKLHQVSRGDTLGTIAKQYKTNPSQISKLNGLNLNSTIFPNQVLKVNIITARNIALKSKGQESFHIVSQGDSLSNIAKQYKTTPEILMALNKIKDPDLLNINDAILLPDGSSFDPVKFNQKQAPQSKGYDWRNYGPLHVNWSEWELMDTSFVAPSRHDNGEYLYIAINCPLRKLNATRKDGSWSNWQSPIEGFENQLVNDVCKSKAVSFNQN